MNVCDTVKIVMSRVWRHWVKWRNQWRHQSTRHGHFPIGSLLDTKPSLSRLVSEIFSVKVSDTQTVTDRHVNWR